jgi:hypothetical protein
MIKEKREVNTSSTSHRGFQRRKDKTENRGPRNRKKKKKNTKAVRTMGRLSHATG